MSSTITDTYHVEIDGPPTKPNFPLFPFYDFQTSDDEIIRRRPREECFSLLTTVRVPDDEGNSYFVDVVQNFKLDPRDRQYMKKRDDMVQKFIHDAYKCLMCTKVDPNIKDPITGRYFHIKDHDTRTERERMLSTYPGARPDAHLRMMGHRKLAPGELPF